MRSVAQIASAKRISSGSSPMQLFRVIGSVDIDGNGTTHEITHVDPFIFLDDAIIEGELPASFNKHPHAGLTAVTYLLEGTAHAWDNIHGATPDLNHAGGVYCVDAARGIVHGEAPIEGMRKIRLFQMWYNPGIYDLPLPQASHQLFQPNDLPVYEDTQLRAKIIIGSGFGLASPVHTRWPIQYLHIKLAPRQTYILQIHDPIWQGFIYVISGRGKFGINEVSGEPQQCLVLGSEAETSIQIENLNDEPLTFIMATGKPHHKAFVKLLGHGGAIVADTEAHARTLMHEYETKTALFGVK